MVLQNLNRVLDSLQDQYPLGIYSANQTPALRQPALDGCL